MMNLNRQLRQLLCQAGLSENELARRTGVAQQVINRLLSGENTNPKLSTLRPLAQYFDVSISELLGEPRSSATGSMMHSIPFLHDNIWRDDVAWSERLKTGEQVWVDCEPRAALFALRMPDDTMEPQFSAGTLLIFDPHAQAVSGDFVLWKTRPSEVSLRQYFFHEAQQYIKSLNPVSEDYELRACDLNDRYFACLIQSRTNYFAR